MHFWCFMVQDIIFTIWSWPPDRSDLRHNASYSKSERDNGDSEGWAGARRGWHARPFITMVTNGTINHSTPTQLSFHPQSAETKGRSWSAGETRPLICLTPTSHPLHCLWKSGGTSGPIVPLFVTTQQTSQVRAHKEVALLDRSWTRQCTVKSNCYLVVQQSIDPLSRFSQYWVYVRLNKKVWRVPFTTTRFYSPHSIVLGL